MKAIKQIKELLLELLTNQLVYPHLVTYIVRAKLTNTIKIKIIKINHNSLFLVAQYRKKQSITTKRVACLNNKLNSHHHHSKEPLPLLRTMTANNNHMFKEKMVREHK